MVDATEVSFEVDAGGEVSGLLVRPPNAKQLLVLAHGAGAGMAHPFLWKLANELAAFGVATFRYQFPYMEQRRRLPDSPAILSATVGAAVNTAKKVAPGLPILAGGKSMGGRMTSHAAAEGKLDGVCGLVFFGFPLHPPGRPGTKRADHLPKVAVSMLFLQGTRDEFADLTLLKPVVAKLGPLATLHIIDSGDHSFHVLKSSGKSDADVLKELAKTTAEWSAELKPVGAS